jgi:hypothetical protein
LPVWRSEPDVFLAPRVLCVSVRRLCSPASSTRRDAGGSSATQPATARLVSRNPCHYTRW